MLLWYFLSLINDVLFSLHCYCLFLGCLVNIADVASLQDFLVYVRGYYLELAKPFVMTLTFPMKIFKLNIYESKIDFNKARAHFIIIVPWFGYISWAFFVNYFGICEFRSCKIVK